MAVHVAATGRRLLTISNSPFESLAAAGPSERIWREMGRGAAAHHVLARHARNRWGRESSGTLHLHQVPALSSKAFPLLAYQAAWLVRRYDIDAITTQDPVLGGIAGVQVGRLLRVPVMVEIHTDVYFHYLRSDAPYERALGAAARYALTHATRVRLVSETFREPVLGAGVDAGRVVFVPYRVDERLFDPQAVDRAAARRELGYGDELVIAAIGRFVPQKGFADLVRAVAGLPSVRVVLVGGGPLEGELRRLIAEHGLGESATVLGWLPQPRLAKLLVASDAYVQPSVAGHGDAMPRTILEAMASGLPVIASAVAGIPGVISDGQNGLLVPGGDPGALAAAIARLRDEPALRERLARAARADAVERFGWESGFARYRDALFSMRR